MTPQLMVRKAARSTPSRTWQHSRHSTPLHSPHLLPVPGHLQLLSAPGVSGRVHQLRLQHQRVPQQVPGRVGPDIVNLAKHTDYFC